MPTVPREFTAPLPGVRVSSGAPSAAFGTPSGFDVGSIRQEVDRIHQTAVDRADQVAELDHDNQLADLATQVQSDALAQKGKNAMGALQQAQAAWQQQASSIVSSGTTDRQRQTAAMRAGARWQQLHATIEAHAADESNKYDADTTNAALANRMNAALTNYRDPGIVGGALAESRGIIAEQAKRLGVAPEVAQAAQDAQTSKIHFGVVSRMLDAGQDLDATKYFAEHRDQINGDDQGKLDRALEAGSRLGEATRQADSILATKDISETDAYAQARQIADPHVRQETAQQLDIEFARRDRAARGVREDARATVIKDLEANGGKLNRGSLAWQAIDGYPEGEQVLAIQEHQFLHPPKDPGDPDKMNSFIGLLATPQTRQQLMATPLTDIVNDDTMNHGQKTYVMNLIRSQVSQDRSARLTDLKSQHADAERAIKDLQRVIKSGVGEDGTALSVDAMEAYKSDLLGAKAKEKDLNGRVRSVERERLVGEPAASENQPPPFATPNAQPSNPFGLSAAKTLTPDMIRGLKSAGPLYDAYASYLKGFGFDVPAVLPTLPEDEQPVRKKP